MNEIVYRNNSIRKPDDILLIIDQMKNQIIPLLIENGLLIEGRLNKY